jgi:hypothetical protein
MNVLEKFSVIKDLTISKIEAQKYIVEIEFETTNIKLTIIPDGDCCSHNWFENFDKLQELVGQKIHTMDENIFCENDESDINPYYRDSYCCNETREVYINGIMFIYKHTCNGYYSGWIEYKLHNYFKNTRNSVIRNNYTT